MDFFKNVKFRLYKFEAAINKAYNKNKGKFNIPGFRKGKAPMNVVEKYYGKETISTTPNGFH